jgi:hypothetical protein
MTLTEEFKEALENSHMTNLEMSWQLGVTMDRLNEILGGSNYQPHEELVMLRFVFKMRRSKMTHGLIIPQKSPQEITPKDHPS